MTALNNSLNSRGLSTKDNLNASTDPTASNDSTQGYGVGSLWMNSTTGRVFIARSVTVATAVWTALELSDHPGYMAGIWYLPAGHQAVAGVGSAFTAGTKKGQLGYVKERITISALGVHVGTLFAGGNTQAALYADGIQSGIHRPVGNALAATASMSTASAVDVGSAVSVQLEPGPYWFFTDMDNATATLISNSANMAGMGGLVGSAARSLVLANQATISGLNVAGTFGTWPNMTGQTFTETNGTIPIVGFQVGSVP